MEYIFETEKNRVTKRKAIKVQCDYCKKDFLKAKRKVKENKKNYCSQSCAVKSRRESLIELVCVFCYKKFKRKESKLNNSKSGLFFCSRKCKDEAQKIKYDFSEMHPDHYGVELSNYRQKAFEAYEIKCACCLYEEEHRILQVHHIDSNRKNNNIDNLIILCPICHAKISYKVSTLTVIGKGRDRKGLLTKI